MKNYLNIKQLSNKLGDRSRSSIYRDIENKKLPEPIRLFGRLYWLDAAIDQKIADAQDEAV